MCEKTVHLNAVNLIWSRVEFWDDFVFSDNHRNKQCMISLSLDQICFSKTCGGVITSIQSFTGRAWTNLGDEISSYESKIHMISLSRSWYIILFFSCLLVYSFILKDFTHFYALLVFSVQPLLIIIVVHIIVTKEKKNMSCTSTFNYCS